MDADLDAYRLDATIWKQSIGEELNLLTLCWVQYRQSTMIFVENSKQISKEMFVDLGELKKKKKKNSIC